MRLPLLFTVYFIGWADDEKIDRQLFSKSVGMRLNHFGKLSCNMWYIIGKTAIYNREKISWFLLRVFSRGLSGDPEGSCDIFYRSALYRLAPPLGGNSLSQFACTTSIPFLKAFRDFEVLRLSRLWVSELKLKRLGAHTSLSAWRYSDGLCFCTGTNIKISFNMYPGLFLMQIWLISGYSTWIWSYR